MDADLGSWKILDSVGSPRLEQEDLGEDDLIVELFQLFQQTFRHGQGHSVLL